MHRLAGRLAAPAEAKGRAGGIFAAEATAAADAVAEAEASAAANGAVAAGGKFLLTSGGDENVKVGECPTNRVTNLV